MNNFLGKIQNRMRSVIPYTKKKLQDAEFDRHVTTVAKTTATVASKVQETGAKTLDALTKQKIDDLVRERILLQERYNDMLAAKLHEALERIKKLEQKLKS